MTRERRSGLGVRVCAALAILTLSISAQGAVGQTVDDNVAKFRLFANCGAMDYSVGSLSSHAAKMGLTEEAVRAPIESRLRSARLYDSSARPYLHAIVHVLEKTFSTTLQYNKIVYDEYSDLSYYAITWKLGGIGTHSGDETYILNILSQNMDRFLVEYLRVNEEACATH